MQGSVNSKSQVVIIGSGPAGLTAAYQLCKLGLRSVVLEKDSVVGGISRTVHHNGYHFDVGGHRFFTKVKIVEDLWEEFLSKDDFLKRRRLSRIYYSKRFFDYPLTPWNALFGLGLWNSFLILVSYCRAVLLPNRNEKTFEDWITNRFGKRLYQIFFKTYTEKVWGIPCSRLSAEWAAQRIRGLSMLSALKNAMLSRTSSTKADIVRTLTDSFHYPKRGPGMMWESVATKVQENGCELRMRCSVEKIFWENTSIIAVESASGEQTSQVNGSHFISSMPLREFIQKLSPPAPEPILHAASRLNYRDFITVALMIGKSDLFPDNWIYIHDPQVKVGRIQNFKNWSPFMVPEPSKSCVGLEYFCFEGDGLWNMPDDALIELAKREFETLGLGKAADVEGGSVVRMPKAYPVYDNGYDDALKTIRDFLRQFDNFYPVGRNGMHKYNNQDHSMLTAILAVENINGAAHNIWTVNADQDYHEVISNPDKWSSEIRNLAATQPDVPVVASSSDPAFVIIREAFARLHEKGLGVALGSVVGLYTFLATARIVLIPEKEIADALELLGHYFIGFQVSRLGAFIGLAYGFGLGFLLGWSIAHLRNVLLDLYLYMVRRKEESRSLEDS
jgi:protoporphyrinogen oxidase